MLLFTAEGTIRMVGRAYEKGIGPAWSLVGNALARWIWTQPDSDRAELKRNNGDFPNWPGGWLVTEHRLHELRGRPPKTRAAILRSKQVDLDQTLRLIDPPNTSDGPGALVRVGGTFIGVPAEMVFEAGARGAATTHGGTAAYIAGGVAAEILGRLVSGESLAIAGESAIAAARRWPGHEAVVSTVESALAGRPTPPGLTGSVRALAAALVIAQSTVDDPGVVLTGVTSDTATLTLAGQLLGADRGVRAFRAEWRLAPDLIGVIDELADASSLAHRVWILHEPLPREIEERYSTADSPLTSHLWARFPGW